jgi:hypothetical protein
MPLTRPAVPDSAVLGFWRVNNVIMEPTAPLPSDAVESLRQQTYQLLPDHTYRATSSGGGSVRGTWAIQEQELRLKDDAKRDDQGVTTLGIEEGPGGMMLVDRPWKGLTVQYVRGLSAAPVARFTISASQLLEETARDPEAARQRYQNQAVAVEGIVNQVHGGPGRDAWVSVFGPDEKSMQSVGLLGGVACFTTDSQPWASLSHGQRVRVVGKAMVDLLPPAQLPINPAIEEPLTRPSTGPATPTVVGQIRLQDAVVVDKGPPPAAPQSAVLLAERFARTGPPSDAAPGIGIRHQIATGKVVSVAGNTLQVGEGGKTIHCDFPSGPAVAAQLATLKPGSDVKVFGEFDPAGASRNKAYTLTRCLLIAE